MAGTADIPEKKWFEKGIYSFFKFEASTALLKADQNALGKCTLCPKSKQNDGISGRVKTSSNFIKHIMVRIESLRLFIHLFYILQYNLQYNLTSLPPSVLHHCRTDGGEI
jgi:hypothetical protein